MCTNHLKMLRVFVILYIAGTKGLPSPKAVVPIVDLFENTNNNNNNNKATVTPAAATSTSVSLETTNLMENILPGNASLTVPTTSLHLAKLALEPSTTEAGMCGISLLNVYE